MPHELQFSDPDSGLLVIHLWRQRFGFATGELHFHGCPNCYHDGPCAADCEHEPDLSEDGTLRGCHAVCDACRIFEVAQ